MWFAALSTYHHNPWLLNLAFKLLSGSEAAFGLLEPDGHFSARSPPKQVRATLYDYAFSSPEESRRAAAALAATRAAGSGAGAGGAANAAAAGAAVGSGDAAREAGSKGVREGEGNAAGAGGVGREGRNGATEDSVEVPAGCTPPTPRRHRLHRFPCSEEDVITLFASIQDLPPLPPPPPTGRTADGFCLRQLRPFAGRTLVDAAESQRISSGDKPPDSRPQGFSEIAQVPDRKARSAAQPSTAAGVY